MRIYRARPLQVGTPERSKSSKLLRTFSQLGESVPGIPLNGRSRLKVRRTFGIFEIFERQLIRDVLYVVRELLKHGTFNPDPGDA